MHVTPSAMPRLRQSRPLRMLLAASVLLLACPVTSRGQDTASPAASASALQEARELLKNGDYDRAIEILKPALAASRGTDGLRDAYLLLIKTYVTLGNSLKLKPQGRETSNLNYKAARELIAECLRNKELRHTQPEPAFEYPPEMIALFSEVRSEIFGSIRIAGLEPADATVLLDGDVLKASQAQGVPGAVDLGIGPHQVIVRREGFRNLTQSISISPNSTLELSYRLVKKRGRLWYSSLAAGTAGVVAGVFLLGQKTSSGAPPTPPEPSLPEAPPPPSN